MDQSPPTIAPRRTAKACVICHKKKIKCDLDPRSGNPCTACVRDGYECRQRERKRKRIYSLESPSPEPVSRPKRESIAHHRSPSSHTETSLLSPGSTRNNAFQVPNAAACQNGYHHATLSAQSGNSKAQSQAEAETLANPATGPSMSDTSGQAPSFSYQPPKMSYLGRSEYIGDDVPINDEEDAPPHSTRGLSEKDKEILQTQRVFELPARAVRDSLIDSYWTRCWPWTPIVERHWIEGRPQSEISILLLQSMMLAGSRVSSSPIESGSPEEFYSKAKMLFWMGVERDPMIMTVSALILNWFNPESPEHYSIDTSGFWVRIAVGLSFQLGLHRNPGDKPDASLRKRVWWTIVTRDNLINAGHGRPRAVCLASTDVPLPTVDDFDGNATAANTFIAYVGISSILGDLTSYFLQKGKFVKKKAALGDRTYRWMKTLPECLQLCLPRPVTSLRPYSFEARQLHVQYFTVLTILNKSTPPASSPSTASLLASSFIAGIFEDFLARDELRYLGPIFTFYLLTAGVTLLSSYRFAGLWHLAEQDLNIIIKSQEELGKRWPSAIGSLKRITDVKARVLKCQRASFFPENNLTTDQRQLFDGFGPDLCRSWNVLHPDSNVQQSATRDIMTAGILTDLYSETAGEPSTDVNGMNDMSFNDTLLDVPWSADQYRGIGNWLFNDWQGLGGMPNW